MGGAEGVLEGSCPPGGWSSTGDVACIGEGLPQPVPYQPPTPCTTFRPLIHCRGPKQSSSSEWTLPVPTSSPRLRKSPAVLYSAGQSLFVCPPKRRTPRGARDRPPHTHACLQSSPRRAQKAVQAVVVDLCAVRPTCCSPTEGRGLSGGCRTSNVMVCIVSYIHPLLLSEVLESRPGAKLPTSSTVSVCPSRPSEKCRGPLQGCRSSGHRVCAHKALTSPADRRGFCKKGFAGT